MTLSRSLSSTVRQIPRMAHGPTYHETPFQSTTHRCFSLGRIISKSESKIKILTAAFSHFIWSLIL